MLAGNVKGVEKIIASDLNAPTPPPEEVSKDEFYEIKSGDTVLVLEAMKMEQQIKSTADGRIVALEVAVGDTVESDQVVAVVG